jgi:hypothetical protein
MDRSHHPRGDGGGRCATLLGADARYWTLRCEGLELLDDDLTDLTFVSLSMESWRRIEQLIKVRYQYPGVVLHHWILSTD